MSTHQRQVRVVVQRRGEKVRVLKQTDLKCRDCLRYDERHGVHLRDFVHCGVLREILQDFFRMHLPCPPETCVCLQLRERFTLLFKDEKFLASKKCCAKSSKTFMLFKDEAKP